MSLSAEEREVVVARVEAFKAWMLVGWRAPRPPVPTQADFKVWREVKR